jgi:hypothetical protein
MSDNPKHPEIIGYGGRRRKFDRWLNPERPTVPECRSRRQRRSGYDRRTIKNNARFKIELERRSNFVQLKNNDTRGIKSRR